LLRCRDEHSAREEKRREERKFSLWLTIRDTPSLNAFFIVCLFVAIPWREKLILSFLLLKFCKQVSFLSLSLVGTFVSNPLRPLLFCAAISAALNCLGAVH
jgi:hypothetical protein